MTCVIRISGIRFQPNNLLTEGIQMYNVIIIWNYSSVWIQQVTYRMTTNSLHRMIIYWWQIVNEKSKGFWYVSALPWSWLYEMNPQHHNIQVIMTKDNVLHIILFVQMRIDLQTKVNWNSKKTFNYGGKWGYSD